MFTPCHFPYRKRAQTRPITLFGGLQNWFWRARSIARFPLPKSHDTFCPPISRFPTSDAMSLRLRFYDAGERIAAILLVLLSPKVLAVLRFLLRFFEGKKSAHCDLAGDRHVCDRKSRFEITIFGAVSPRPQASLKKSGKSPEKTCSTVFYAETLSPNDQGPLSGGVSNGGVSRSGLVLPFLSFFVLFGCFPIFLGFSRFARGWSGDFPDLLFSSFSAYYLRGTVPKGSATQSGPFPKEVGNTRIWKPPGLASLKTKMPTREATLSGAVPQTDFNLLLE